MELIDRIKSPTPPWWKKVRNIAGTVALIGGVVLTLPVSLPVGLVTAVTTITIVSGTIAGTAQATKEDK